MELIYKLLKKSDLMLAKQLEWKHCGITGWKWRMTTCIECDCTVHTTSKHEPTYCTGCI